jgi:hypothetical protein
MPTHTEAAFLCQMYVLQFWCEETPPTQHLVLACCLAAQGE